MLLLVALLLLKQPADSGVSLSLWQLKVASRSKPLVLVTTVNAPISESLRSCMGVLDDVDLGELVDVEEGDVVNKPGARNLQKAQTRVSSSHGS